MLRKPFVVVGLMLAATLAPVQAQDVQTIPNEKIAEILQERLEAGPATGIVVGVIEPNGRRVVAEGTLGADDERPVDGDTIFEVGSVNKVFTTLLLAEAVQRGEVALDDPVAQFLPAEAEVPERGGRRISLLDLATQSSGLPRLPTNIDPADPQDPYADYGTADLYAFLADYSLPRDIGTQFEYSNLGMGLLGHTLSLAAGETYEALLEERVLAPLQLEDTGIELSDAQQARMAAGHDAYLRPTSYWTFDALASAGALRSTANDLLDFLAAAMGLVETPLAPAFAATLEPRRPTGMPDTEIGLGWFVSGGQGSGTVAWHNGITGGFHAFIGFRSDSQTGVVVLANSSALPSRDIGLHLLEPSVPLPPPTPVPELANLSPEALDAYVGTYRLTPDFTVTVTRRGDSLLAQATGQGAAEILPLGEHRFVHSQVEAEVTFEVDEDGRATGLVLHQGGAATPGARID